MPIKEQETIDVFNTRTIDGKTLSRCRVNWYVLYTLNSHYLIFITVNKFNWVVIENINNLIITVNKYESNDEIFL